MSMQGNLLPHLLLKTNLVNPPQCWGVLWEAYPTLLTQIHDLGIYGVEVAVRCKGIHEEDVSTLEELRKWVRPWYDAGLRVYIHPYTSGDANPAVCEGNSGGTPIETFKYVANEALAMADMSGELVKLTYHAAEVLPSDTCPEPCEIREVALYNSVHFFNLAAAYLGSCGNRVQLLSETQLPTRADEKRIRIADRLDEILATVRDNSTGICWDTGHYLKACEMIGMPSRPPQEFVDRVRHMHLHDVVDQRDHRLLRQDSDKVAAYVEMAIGNDALDSITLEYDYGQGAAKDNAELILKHIGEACEWVRSWVLPT